MTNKWFRASSNRSGSARQLAGKAGFGDLCTGSGRRGGDTMLEGPEAKTANLPDQLPLKSALGFIRHT